MVRMADISFHRNIPFYKETMIARPGPRGRRPSSQRYRKAKDEPLSPKLVHPRRSLSANSYRQRFIWNAPEVPTDSLCHSISSITDALHLLLLNTDRGESDETTVRREGRLHFAKNAIFHPLHSLWGVMNAFDGELDNWAHRTRRMEYHYQRIRKHRTFGGRNTYTKEIEHYLEDVPPLDLAYQQSFRIMIERLQGVHHASRDLVPFLDEVLRGNVTREIASLPSQNVAYDRVAGHETIPVGTLIWKAMLARVHGLDMLAQAGPITNEKRQTIVCAKKLMQLFDEKLRTVHDRAMREGQAAREMGEIWHTWGQILEKFRDQQNVQRVGTSYDGSGSIRKDSGSEPSAGSISHMSVLKRNGTQGSVTEGNENDSEFHHVEWDDVDDELVDTGSNGVVISQ